MIGSYRIFRSWKQGNAPEEYEDAASGVEEENVSRFAVADGATESGFAATWAQMLAEHFVAADVACALSWSDWLPAVQRNWLESVRDRAASTWFAEEKFKEGAFATFLGVVVSACPEGHRRWHAVAVGDSCLFHTRDLELLAAFPLEQQCQFGASPWLVGSRSPPELVKEKAMEKEGEALPGDQLWMMTDALAHWFLSEVEAGNTPWCQWEPFLGLPDSDRSFASWLDELRDARRIRNDDVTLLAVSL